MTVNLRLSLTVFKIGFLVESVSGFAALLTASSQLPFHGYLLFLSPVFSGLGILFLYIGRHEWNELHRTRVRFASAAFGVSLGVIALAAAPVAYLSAVGGPSPPAWVGVEFGVAIALVFATTFVTYVVVAAHLVGRLGEVAMALGVGWAVIVSSFIGIALVPALHPIVRAVVSRSTAVSSFTQPITFLDALLAFSYLAFFVAFADAHYRVARGRVPEDSPPTALPAGAPSSPRRA